MVFVSRLLAWRRQHKGSNSPSLVNLVVGERKIYHLGDFIWVDECFECLLCSDTVFFG